LSRLARENPEDDRYQSLGGQREVLAELVDRNKRQERDCPHANTYRDDFLGELHCDDCGEVLP
jgi:hypothetical protein